MGFFVVVFVWFSVFLSEGKRYGKLELGEGRERCLCKCELLQVASPFLPHPGVLPVKSILFKRQNTWF